MLENPQSGSRDHAALPDDSGTELASQALSNLSLRTNSEEITLIAQYVAGLHDAAVDLEADSFEPVLKAMHDARITNQQIADHYLPAVARKMGEDWCDDTKSFAQVTIGVSRLQRLLLELGPEWHADMVADYDAPTVLVLTGPSSDHTFGAKIIVGQLRRRGLSVRLAVGLRPHQLRTLLGKAHFDVVMISASLADAMAPLRAVADAIRASESWVPPIVLGGSICLSQPEIGALIGADYVTNDVDEAIRLCGLNVQKANHSQPSKQS